MSWEDRKTEKSERRKNLNSASFINKIIEIKLQLEFCFLTKISKHTFPDFQTFSDFRTNY